MNLWWLAAALFAVAAVLAVSVRRYGMAAVLLAIAWLCAT
jgi:hypothetical protein